MSTPKLNSSFHDHNQPQQPIPKKGSSKSSGGGRRRKPNNGLKQPRRGMGVQQLELHLRMQEAAAATRQNKLSLQGHFNKKQSSSSDLRNINVLYPVEYSNGGVSDYAADLMLRQQRRKQQRLYFEEWVKRYGAEDGSGQIFPMANVEHEGKAVGLEEEELSSVPKMTLINGQLYDYQSTNCQLPCCTHLEKKRFEYGGGMAASMGLKYSNEIRATAGEDEATAKVLPLVNRSSYNYYPLGLLGSSHGSTSTTTQLQQLGTVDMVGTSERQKEYYEFIPTHKTSTFPEEEDDHDHDHDQVLMEGSASASGAVVVMGGGAAAASCLTTSDHHHDDQLQFQQQYYSSSGYNYRVASNYYPNYNGNSLDLSLKL
ncbi:hypothetical protein LINPERHAP1_LOCUS45181 [Linum perenne]